MLINNMDDNAFLIFGYVASANACMMMIPQVYLTVKKNSFEDLSIHMIFMNLLTQCLFLPYTIHFKLYPLLTVNTVLSSCDLLIIYHYYRKKNADPEFMKESLVDNLQP